VKIPFVRACVQCLWGSWDINVRSKVAIAFATGVSQATVRQMSGYSFHGARMKLGDRCLRIATSGEAALVGAVYVSHDRFFKPEGGDSVGNSQIMNAHETRAGLEKIFRVRARLICRAGERRFRHIDAAKFRVPKLVSQGWRTARVMKQPLLPCSCFPAPELSALSSRARHRAGVALLASRTWLSFIHFRYSGEPMRICLAQKSSSVVEHLRKVTKEAKRDI